MAKKHDFYKRFIIDNIIVGLVSKHKEGASFPIKIGPYALQEMIFPFGTALGLKEIKDYIINELKDFGPVLKKEDGEEVVYFEIGSEDTKSLSELKFPRIAAEETTPFNDYVTNQILTTLNRTVFKVDQFA